jgi:hypothetical protein
MALLISADNHGVNLEQSRDPSDFDLSQARRQMALQGHSPFIGAI